MAVHLTRIYTGLGDDGTTALGDMSRVPKTDPRIEAYSTVEEANAVLGLALAIGALSVDLAAVVRDVQNDLFDVGADLSTPVVADPEHPPLRTTRAQVDRLEGWCDEFNERLGTLDSFLLPGGTPGAAYLHLARVVVRRAERSVWHLLQADAEHTNELTATYLNRLSDLLFVLGRCANPEGDTLWQPGRSTDTSESSTS
jgi:cob(I)alamin adenosyltransferase